jgi:tetratricopeptide (TPR) repeat protein
MKRCLCSTAFIAVLLCIVSISAEAQQRNPPGMAQVTSEHYQVLSDGGGVDAANLSRELESRFALYNRIFHFNDAEVMFPLKVRAYKDKKVYEDYVTSRLSGTRAGAVYLHYNQADRRELVIHRGSADEERMFPHQAFIQYLRAFIPYPPAWLREGFAIYFNTLTFDADAPTSVGAEKNGGAAVLPGRALNGGGLAYEENLAWLESVKNLGDNAPSIEAILRSDIDGMPEHPEYFPSVSWALVSFFMNSEKDYYYTRILFESFMKLSRPASAIGNAEAILAHIQSWTSLDALRKDYKAYLDSRKTFAELITEGQQAYSKKDIAQAEVSFLSALNQKPTHFAPYYYLGLLAYEAKSYDQAEQYYRSALQYGAEVALVSYARGVNAASAGRNAEAISYLEQAAVSTEYKERANSLITRLR